MSNNWPQSQTFDVRIQVRAYGDFDFSSAPEALANYRALPVPNSAVDSTRLIVKGEAPNAFALVEISLADIMPVEERQSGLISAIRSISSLLREWNQRLNPAPDRTTVRP